MHDFNLWIFFRQTVEKFRTAIVAAVIYKNDLPIFREVLVHDGLNLFKKWAESFALVINRNGE